MKNNNIKSILKCFLKMCFVIIILTLGMFVFSLLFGLINSSVRLDEIKIVSLNFLLLLGYAVIIKSLLGLVNSLDHTPFIKENVKRLSNIGYVFFLGAIIDILYNSILNQNQGVADVMGINITISLITFSVFSLLFIVLSEVFNKAIIIKEENDLTI